MVRCKSCGYESESGLHNCVGFQLEAQQEVFIKNDKSKPRMELLDPDFMVGVAQVLTFGAEKYDAYNWQKADKDGIERIKGAMLRHQMAYMNGEQVDPETGLNHMYHISCNAMFLAYFDRHNKEHIGQGTLDLCDGMHGDNIKAEDIK